MLTHTMAKFRRMPRRVCRTVWETMPASVAQTPIMNKTGRFIYRRFTRDTVKVQTHFTHFMRNPPLLDALTQLTGRMETGEPLRIASIGCSTGAELYSVLYTLRKAYPGKEILGYGSDLSEEVVKVAQLGRYKPGRAAGEGGMFHAGRPEVEASEVAEFSGLLEPGKDGVCEVHGWLKAGTSWFAADAIKDDIVAMIGPQDVVLANNFMGPMDDRSADQCLRNMMGLVRPGGILVIDGVDLDVKTRAIRGSRFTPVLINQDAIWTSDESKQGWPWLRWAAEPIDRSEPDWRVRYTIIFQRSH